MTVASDNAKEEIREIIDNCIKCGRCKSLCPVFKVLREEHYSPRGKVILMDNNYFEKILSNCTLCKACERKCPLDLKLSDAFMNARKILVEQKKEFAENREMIRNLNRTGNIFGIKEESN